MSFLSFICACEEGVCRGEGGKGREDEVAKSAKKSLTIGGKKKPPSGKEKKRGGREGGKGLKSHIT